METTLQNNEEDVRVSAAVALDQPRKLTEVSRQILVDAMKNYNRPYTAALRENAVRALGEQPTLSELDEAILEAVLQDSDADVRVLAAVVLTQHRKLTDAGRRVLVDAVKNHNGLYKALLRGNAAWALGEQSTLSESEQTALKTALQDSEADVRVRAAVALNQHHKLTEVGRQVLVDAVKNHNGPYTAGFRGNAAWALGQQSTTLTELEQTALEAALQDSEADLRAHAAVALNQHRQSTEAVRQVLADAVKNHNGPYAINAACALGEQAALSELEQTILEAALQDNKADMRACAAVALAKHRQLTEAGRQVLVDAVKNHNGPYAAVLRNNSASALGEQSALSELEQATLEAVLQDSDSDMRVLAAVALNQHRQLPEAGRQVLVDAVKNHNGPYTVGFRGNAAWALGQQSTTLTQLEQTALEAALQDSEADVRVRAAVALNQHRQSTEAVRQVLADAVKNHNGLYAINAAWALGEQATLSEVEQAILEAALQDSEADVRVRAAVALTQHGQLPEAGRQVLVDAVKNHNGPYTVLRRGGAAWALGEQATLSESEQVILEAALQDSEAEMRVRAAVALNQHRQLTEVGRQVLVDAVKNHNGPYTVLRRDDAAWALGEQAALSESEQTVLEAALQDNEADMRVRVAVALSQHGQLTEVGRQVLVDAVKNHNGPYTAVRRDDAAWALGEQATLSESEQVILEAALQDSEADVRVRAAVALNQHRKLTEAGRQVLVDAVKNHNGPYTVLRRGGAAWALGEQATLSESEQTILEAALQDNESEMRVRAAVALNQHRKLTEAGRQVLVDAVKNHNGSYTVVRRDDAAWALGEQAALSESEQAALEAALQDNEVDVRVRAAVALNQHRQLTEVGRQVFVDAVKNHNGSYSAELRETSAWALGVQAALSESEQTALEAALQDSEADVRVRAAIALNQHRKLTEAGRQVLVDVVKNHNGRYAISAVWVLGEQSTLSESEQTILEAALQDNEAEMRVRAAVALNQHHQLTEVGRQVFVDAVKNHNGSYSAGLRESSAWALGGQATLSESEQTTLEAALQDNEAGMRACVAVALSRHRQLTEAGRQVLVDAVKNHNGLYKVEFRENAVLALEEQATLSALEQTALEAALQDDEADVRVRAAIALSGHSQLTEVGRQVFVGAVKNHNGPYKASLRENSAWILGGQAALSESEQTALEAALQDNDADMRACAAIALSRHRKLTEAGQQVLMDAVKNHNGSYKAELRENAARALEEQPTLPESEQTALEAALQDDEADVRVRAAIALSRHGKLTEAAREVLVDALENHNETYAMKAAWILGEQATLSESERTALEAALQDNDADMRACAAIALSRHRQLTEAERQILVNEIKNHNGPYAISAAWALGEEATLSESEQAILKYALQDNKADMRACAAIALSRHRQLTEAGQQVLVDAVKNHNGPYTVALRAHAALALGEQATLSESEQNVLKAALQDNEAEVRARAAVALDQHRKLTEFSYLIH